MTVDKQFAICKLILMILILTACNPGTSISTPTSSVAIRSDEAIELATDQCSMPGFVLKGEPSATKAMLMSRTDAEKWSFPEPATTEDIQIISESVWLVEIQGEFQLEGAPPPEPGTRPTDEPPRMGVCWVIVDAKTGEILGMQGQTK